MIQGMTLYHTMQNTLTGYGVLPDPLPDEIYPAGVFHNVGELLQILFFNLEDAMNYRAFGNTGLQVSELCLGTMTFGGQVEEAEAVRLIHCALDHGVNLIDTANNYFGGRSEICVGKALRGRRDKVILSTKAGNIVGNGPGDRGLSRTHVMQQIDLSLRRLDTDYIDIYFMHLPDHITPMEDALETYNDLLTSGKIRYIGMSNFAAWECCEALYTSLIKHIHPPMVTQMLFNLLERGLENEFIPFVQAKNMGLMTFNPLAGGLLSGRYQWIETPPEEGRFSIFKSYAPRYWTEENLRAAASLAELAAENGISMVNLAMRWCAFQPGVSTVVTGVSKESQLCQNLNSVTDGPLPPEILLACDKIWDQLSGKRLSYNR